MPVAAIGDAYMNQIRNNQQVNSTKMNICIIIWRKFETSTTLSSNYANILNFSGNRKGHLTVIQDPNQNHNLTFPHIEGLKDNYTDASHVMLTCISSSLKPAPRFEIPDLQFGNKRMMIKMLKNFYRMIIISFHFSLAWYYKVPDSVNTTGAETPVPLTSLTQFPVTVNAHGYEYSRLGIVLQFGKIDKLLLCTSLVAATCSNPMERRCDSVLSYWIEIGSY